MKKYNGTKSSCWTKYVAVREKNVFCTNLWTCNDYTNRPGEFHLDVRSSKLINDESEDNSSSDDEYHNAMDDDKLDISDYNLLLKSVGLRTIL